MTNRTNEMSQRQAAILAGIAYLIMFLAAIFSEFMVRQSIVVPGDAAATASNLLASGTLFRAGIGGYLAILLSDLVLAWALYVFFKQVNQSLSLFTAWARLVYTAIFGSALANLVVALRLVSVADYMAAFETPQLHAQVLLFLNTFNDAWAVAYLFFAIHLFLLGCLALQTRLIPKIVGILLIVSSFTYVVDNVAKLLMTNYEAYQSVWMILAMPSFLGEFLLVLWLVISIRKIPQTKQPETPA